MSGENRSIPCSALGMGHVAPCEVEELILGHVGPLAGLSGISVPGDGSCDCSQVTAKGKKELEVYSSLCAAREPPDMGYKGKY